MNTSTDSLEIFKAHLEKIINKARSEIAIHDGIQSLFVVTDGKEVQEVPVTLEDDMRDIEAIEIETICSDATVKLAALILKGHTLMVDTVDVPKYEGKSLKALPESVQALMVVIYTPTVSFVRTIPFKKKGDRDYWFGDMGWQEAPDIEGIFGNPFKK